MEGVRAKKSVRGTPCLGLQGVEMTSGRVGEIGEQESVLADSREGGCYGGGRKRLRH
jgi:hypothetical protein